MKRFFERGLLLFLAALMLLPMLASCKNEGSDGMETRGDTTASTAQIAASAIASYQIVYPEGSMTTEIFRKLFDVEKKIENTFGVDIKLTDDFYREGVTAPIPECEILIGETNRPESRQVCSDLKAKDYSIQLVGKKLVVAAISDESLLEAIGSLMGHLDSLHAESAVFYDSALDKTVRGTYAIRDVLIDGKSISSFRLVYASSDSGCKNIAEQLCDTVRERTGYILDIVSDAKKAEEGVGEILVGKTSRENPEALESLASEAYYLGQAEQTVWIAGNDAYGTYHAAKAFEALLVAPDGTEELTLTLDSDVKTIEDDSMIAMSFNVYVSNPTSRLEAVKEIILKHRPHSFGVQEASPTWMTYLTVALQDEYFYVGEGRDGGTNGEYSAVFYRKDTFNLIESGTKWLTSTPDQVSSVEGSTYPRIFSYALLERKADGKRFMHINTHLHHKATEDDVRVEQVNYLKQFIDSCGDIPILLSGDLNAVSTQQSFINILNIGFENSADLALIRDTTFTVGGSRTIDYILFTKGDFKVLSYDVDDSKVNGIQPSDHNAVIVRYEFN